MATSKCGCLAAHYMAAYYNQKTHIRSEKINKGQASHLITATTSDHLPKSVPSDPMIQVQVLPTH